MKTYIKYLTLLTIAFYLSNDAWSQKVTVNANINVGTPASYTYYYYPDYEVYYTVETDNWFIRRNGIWASYHVLPMEYFFIRNGGCERVLLPYHGKKHPFAYHPKFKNAYPKYYKDKHHDKHIDYKTNTTWKSKKSNAHMKTKISNGHNGGGKSKGKHKNK